MFMILGSQAGLLGSLGEGLGSLWGIGLLSCLGTLKGLGYETLAFIFFGGARLDFLRHRTW